MLKKGRLITLEGPDTAGKTTLIEKLKTALPIIYSNETFLFTREPGNLLHGQYNKSETIRERLLTDNTLTTDEQAKLFAESRYYHTIDIIKELNKGHNVITDRYLFSSIIYQGLDINNLVLQISMETYEERMYKKEKDAIEDVEYKKICDRILYHNTVKSVNEDIGNHLGVVYTIDANKTPSDVIIEALNHIHKIIR